MKCKDWELLIALEIEGDLPAVELASLHSHLSSCWSCQQTRQTLLISQQQLKLTQRVGLDEKLLQRFHADVMRQITTPPPGLGTWWSRWTNKIVANWLILPVPYVVATGLILMIIGGLSWKTRNFIVSPSRAIVNNDRFQFGANVSAKSPEHIAIIAAEKQIKLISPPKTSQPAMAVSFDNLAEAENGTFLTSEQELQQAAERSMQQLAQLAAADLVAALEDDPINLKPLLLDSQPPAELIPDTTRHSTALSTVEAIETARLTEINKQAATDNSALVATTPLEPVQIELHTADPQVRIIWLLESSALSTVGN